MSKDLKPEFPVQGWKQFLTSRKEMLDAYDRAREKARSHEVETYHGKVAEAEFRKWLTNFLPKRYGVTSGYIISQGLSSKEKTPHFDVIIYDAIESPVLWIEENPDTSIAGNSMAIPAEYVVGVLEVKSSFNLKTVKQGIEHLVDLNPLLGGLDEPTEKYKLYFPRNFFCGLVFFELRENEQFNENALKNIIMGFSLRGFFGGIILRGENHKKQASGRITILKSKTPMDTMIGKSQGLLYSGGHTKSEQFANDLHLAASLVWMEMYFSRFAFDILAMIKGTYEVGVFSSMHGIGGDGWE